MKQALEERRDAPVELRHAQRGEKRRICTSWRSATRALRSSRTSCAASAAASSAWTRSTTCAKRSAWTRCRCGSRATTSRTSAPSTRSRRWSSSRAARRKKSDYRRFKIRKLGRPPGRLRGDAGGPVAAHGALAGAARPLAARPRARRRASRRCPALIVIDGGKGQLSSGVAGAGRVHRRQGVVVVSLAKRLEEIYVPGRSRPIVLPRDSRALQLLQRIRDEAHRFAVEHHRSGRSHR